MTQTAIDFVGKREKKLFKEKIMQANIELLSKVKDHITRFPQAANMDYFKLRDFRKLGHTVLRRRVEGQKGLWEYRLLVKGAQES